ncbi:hypothetical protein QUG92_04995 [Curtobacterium sp. RHCKG23]|jgi:hypothetical protein|uniref:Lipoprotein n=1 Tax=Curtobacterium citri TaxID=3055139 RepID=A0ABT7T4E9_9MICO|nr:hypothetical protein [Curtobacterium citri]MDM7884454.1 hypothetical protein [Curtobacterium citri]
MGSIIEMQGRAQRAEITPLASAISLFGCAHGHKESSASFWACA